MTGKNKRGMLQTPFTIHPQYQI